MSTSISNEQRLRALHRGDPEEPTKRSRRASMVHWVMAAAILAGVSGVILVTIEMATPAYLNLASYIAACFILSGLAGVVLCVNWMLADRQAFYQRGKVDGFYQGWHGQLPDVDDPLLRD
jgi:hypothetical protein